MLEGTSKVFIHKASLFVFYPFNGPHCRVNGLLVQNPSPREDEHILAC